MNISLGNLSKSALIFAFAVFFFAAVFGLGHFGVPMAMGAAVSDCPFMPGTSICNMAIFGHINSWQAMFALLPAKQNSLLSLLSLILSFIAAALSFVWFYRAHFNENHILARFFSRCAKKYIPSTFLEEAFARGILNPKLF